MKLVRHEVWKIVGAKFPCSNKLHTRLLRTVKDYQSNIKRKAPWINQSVTTTQLNKGWFTRIIIIYMIKL